MSQTIVIFPSNVPSSCKFNLKEKLFVTAFGNQNRCVSHNQFGTKCRSILVLTITNHRHNTEALPLRLRQHFASMRFGQVFSSTRFPSKILSSVANPILSISAQANQFTCKKNPGVDVEGEAFQHASPFCSHLELNHLTSNMFFLTTFYCRVAPRV